MNFKRLPDNLYETFVTALIVVGLPLVAYIYIDWRAALTAFVLVNIVLGVMVLRGKE